MNVWALYIEIRYDGVSRPIYMLPVISYTYHSSLCPFQEKLDLQISS